MNWLILRLWPTANQVLIKKLIEGRPIIYGCSGDISYECDCLYETSRKTMNAIGCYDNSTDFILIWNMLIWLMSRKFPNLESNGAECGLWRCR